MTWPNPSFSRWRFGPDRAIVEDGLKLDVDKAVKAGLKSSASTVWRCWQWTAAGILRATIGYRVELVVDGFAWLHLDFTRGGKEVKQTIMLQARTCRFGGVRWIAKCPSSLRSTYTLYLPNGGARFLGRKAYRLGYRSQCLAPTWRMLHRHDKLLNRLGALDASTIDKPKGMHWKTFDAILAEIERCNMGSLAIIGEKWLHQ